MSFRAESACCTPSLQKIKLHHSENFSRMLSVPVSVSLRKVLSTTGLNMDPSRTPFVTDQHQAVDGSSSDFALGEAMLAASD